ncbi:pyruvate dehydrogenase (acetyl-transferring) E1 component subunit alpha [Desulfoprunum benzoelyticum]|uniref:Pyruvate dehydrogenase E1 component subunit alpha n=1 Tax=Desulfoprunum benzoelyticum TaxID=1506996 RepID=A0A840UXQ8_9BACT|nr:pyruvate dehydrogenase (acetyl-transferring) E1 component subunit alpha [Desulfoprunum benzoelyticum]MBB5348234.1 pyruvate dehydrogenase E1 component alpha subunit [Desulfoprunum benzoelyticum]MBM9529574.1 pyruvate dehydrogenase (acetyl-transferring) E1 component subunit alpha [Desulfoprunum benzoelyticum]
MPRSDIAVTDSLESLSILDEHGNLDRDLEPQLSKARLLELYRAMLLGRRFDERLLDLQRQGRIGTFPPIKGQEAAQMGAVFNLRPSDWFVPAFRETAAEIWRGRSLESIILYFNGFNEGGLVPEGRKDLPIAIPVGSQVLHAVGLGWAARYRQTDEIVMTFFGDGATSAGDFHEGLNFAAVYQTPVVFVCQNNQWAISVPVSRQTHTPTLAQKAHAYGMPGIRVDGNDVLAVYAAAAEAAERARSGGGPTLIECVTYRVMMHTTADDPKRYRSEEEVAQWQQRDPLPRFAAYLQQKGTATEPQLAEMETGVMEEIQAAVDAAEKRMGELGDPLAMFDHLYAEMPPQLEAQKSALARELADGGKEVDDE